MLRLKRFFPLFLIIFFLLICFSKVTYKANAQTNCTSNPVWTLDRVSDGATSVVFHLFLKNNCPASKDFNLRVTQLPTSPHNYAGWSWKFANGAQNTVYVKTIAGESRAAVNLTVS